MADGMEVVIVTIAAAIALGVLLRPLLPGIRPRRGEPQKSAGCSAWEKDSARV